MRQRSVVDSFNSAIEGFFYVMKSQRNMRLHFLAAVLIILAALYLQAPLTNVLILCAAISLVLIMEMVNTAMEHAIDMLTETFHPLARIIKDIMAGSVLISAVNAFIVGYAVFQPCAGLILGAGIRGIRQSPWHLTFIAVILVMAIVVAAKMLFHKGTPLRGGMPSGHAAFIFSVWVIITLLSDNSLIAALSLIMAVLVCRSRIKEHVHNVWEVAAGAVLGALVTMMIFQITR